MIVENDECLADRGQQCMAQSSTITKKDDPVSQKSALNDLNFKPKSTLLVKYYIFLKRAWVWASSARSRGRGRQADTLLSVEPNMGLDPQPEIRSGTLNRLNHPGAPVLCFYMLLVYTEFSKIVTSMSIEGRIGFILLEILHNLVIILENHIIAGRMTCGLRYPA